MDNKVKLGSVLKIMHGYAFKSENYVEKSQYRLITLGNFEEGNNSFKYNDAKATYYGADFPKEFIVQSGDLIMPLTEQVVGLFGNSAFVPLTNDYTFVLNQRVGKVICNEDMVDKYYIHYLLATESVKNQLEARASGTRQRNISPNDVYDVDVFLPDLQTQKKIGALLYDIEQKQENNNVGSAVLEAMAKLIYDYWFVQFDFPDENGKPYKTSGGKMAWSEELKREIPEGWEVGNIIENPLSTVVGNGVDWFESKNYLPTANVNGEEITDGEWITFGNKESRANMQPTAYSVWFAKMKNSIKHISIPADSDWFIHKYILSTGFEGIQCNKYSFGYIHCIVNSEYFERHKDTVAHGATQESVNDDDLKNIKFVIPPKQLLDSFSTLINPILESKFARIHENQQLASLRDFLLPMLMNGQVTIQETRNELG